ncbi:PIN domain-containing protein [Candidatus Poribacteria bacterium]|nr:PIN domain-containing protein [Candidatus Poribacteria bacterium]
MNHKGILPDTCAWIEYFKPQASKLKQIIEHLLLNEVIFIVGPILYELLQGLKSTNEKAIITDAFKSLEYIEMSEHLWMKSAELSLKLRKEGKTIPMSDILIAACTLENNLSIVTIDNHFKDIPGVQIYNQF